MRGGLGQTGGTRRVELVILNQYYLPDVASTGHLVAELAQEIACCGTAVAVVTCFPCYGPKETWQPCCAVEVRDGVSVRRIRTTRFGKDTSFGRISDSLSFLFPLAVRMFFTRSRDRVFMYTSNPPFLGVIGALVSIVRRHKYIVLLHDSYPHIAVLIGRVRRGSWIERMWHLVNGQIYRRARQTIVLCDKAKELIVHEYGVSPDRVQVIHNWADPNTLRPCPKEQCHFARQHGYDKKFTLLYSGNLGLYYDFETLVRAADRLRNDATIKFVFVGAGGRKAYIGQRIAELGLTNIDVHQYQPFSALNDSLNSCDASLVTIAEGVEGISFPSKFYSSLAVGKPVLALSEPGSELQRMVTETSCGLWSPIGDVDALVANIAALRSDSVRMSAMGRAAREAMEHNFTIKAAAQEYLRVMKLALAGTTASSAVTQSA